MAFYATDEMKALKGVFDSHFRTFKDGEFYIVEGSAQGQGYHHSREDLNRRFGEGVAYSVKHILDQQGDAKAASAFDLLFGDEDELYLATKRLNDAARKKDPRVYMKVREFGGTLDGEKVTAYNVTEQRSISFDSSHLWHLHVSIHRKYTKDAAVLKGIADVICGVPLEVIPSAPFKVGDYLEASVDTQAYYGPAGTFRANVAKGYRVSVTDTEYKSNKWWVKGSTYWYLAADLKKYVAPAPKVISKYIVNTNVLNVRSSGSTASSSNIVGQAERGQKLQGYEVNEGGRVWVVDSAGTYFAKQYLLKYVAYRVDTDLLNVRSGPSTSNPVVKQVKRGTWVLVTEVSNGWAKDVDGNYYMLEYLQKA